MIGWIVAGGFALLALAMLVLARVSTAHADRYAVRIAELEQEVAQANSDRALAKMYWEMQSDEAKRLTKECYEARRLYAVAAKERIELGRKLDEAQAMILQAEQENGKLRSMVADPIADQLANALHDSERELEQCVQECDSLKLQLEEALKPRKRTKGVAVTTGSDGVL